jgi:hypothetical protein
MFLEALHRSLWLYGLAKMAKEIMPVLIIFQSLGIKKTGPQKLRGLPYQLNLIIRGRPSIKMKLNRFPKPLRPTRALMVLIMA